MIVNVAVYRIKPQFVDEFKTRILQHAANCTRLEPGCLLFDVNQSRTDSTVFLMYEHFTDQAAVDAHSKTQHYADFIRRRDGEGWLADRTVYLMNPIFPEPKK